MKNNEFKIIITIFTLVFALGIFLGGFTLYNKWGLEGPLVEQLANIEGVEEVFINKDNKNYEISLELGKNDNFSEIYNKALAICETKLGVNNFDVFLIDNPNNKLNEIYIGLQPIIYESIAKNEFLWLDDSLKLMAGEETIDYELFIDDVNIYIKLSDKDYFIYKVLVRLPEVKANT